MYGSRLRTFQAGIRMDCDRAQGNEKDRKRKARVSDLEIRSTCKEYALHYVDFQREQFKRLGVLGEWDHPYLTLRPEFEARQIKAFGEMAKKGYIYKGKKAVYWCPDCVTALAEAEIEYADDPCDSIYVRFSTLQRITESLKKLGCRSTSAVHIGLQPHGRCGANVASALAPTLIMP